MNDGMIEERIRPIHQVWEKGRRRRLWLTNAFTNGRVLTVRAVGRCQRWDISTKSTGIPPNELNFGIVNTFFLPLSFLPFVLILSFFILPYFPPFFSRFLEVGVGEGGTIIELPRKKNEKYEWDIKLLKKRKRVCKGKEGISGDWKNKEENKRGCYRGKKMKLQSYLHLYDCLLVLPMLNLRNLFQERTYAKK